MVALRAARVHPSACAPTLVSRENMAKNPGVSATESFLPGQRRGAMASVVKRAGHRNG